VQKKKKRLGNLSSTGKRDRERLCDWLEAFSCASVLLPSLSASSAGPQRRRNRVGPDGQPGRGEGSHRHYGAVIGTDRVPLLPTSTVWNQHRATQVALAVQYEAKTELTYDMDHIEKEPPLHCFAPRFQGLCPLGHQEVVVFCV